MRHAGVSRQEFYRELRERTEFRDAVSEAERASHAGMKPIMTEPRPQGGSPPAMSPAPWTAREMPVQVWLVVGVPLAVAIVLIMLGAGSGAPALHW
jgi:hypothetical protein